MNNQLIYNELLAEFDSKIGFEVEDRGKYFREFSDRLRSQNRHKLIAPLYDACWESGVGYACSIIIQGLEKTLNDDEIIVHYLNNVSKMNATFENRYEFAIVLPKVLQYKDFIVGDALSAFLSRHEIEIDRRRTLLFENFEGEKYGFFNLDPFSLYNGSLVNFYTDQFLAINKDIAKYLSEEAGKVGENIFGVNISWVMPNLEKAVEIGIKYANKVDDELGEEPAKKFIKHYFEFVNKYADECGSIFNLTDPNEHSFSERFLITFVAKLKEKLPDDISIRNMIDMLDSGLLANTKAQERLSVYLNYEF